MIEKTQPVAIITGSGQGIGKVLKKTFQDNGYRVIGVDKNHAGDFVADLAVKEDLEAFIDHVKEQTSHVECIINNACFSNGGLETCDYEGFNEILRLGLTAPFYLAKSLRTLFGPNMTIINIASSRAFQSQVDTESYSAAKGGLIALTHAMAISLSGVARVNAISPGWIDNETDDHTRENNEQHPSARVGKPEDIAHTALFLADEKSGFITGENIMVDGGMSKLMIYHNDQGWHYKI